MDSNLIPILSRTLDISGKVLVSYMAIRVHHRVWKDHKIDKRVFANMKQEQRIGLIGISFMVLAYIVEMAELFAYI